MMEFEKLQLPADRLSGEGVVTLFFQDQRPLAGPAAILDWRLDGQLTNLMLENKVVGRAGEQVILQNNGKLLADWVMFIGGGKWHDLCLNTYKSLINHIVVTVRTAGFKDISICLSTTQFANSHFLEEYLLSSLKSKGQGISKCRFSCVP